MKKIIIPIVHLIIFLIAITSFLWIDWKIVLAGFILYELQIHLFKGCILSFWQFGKSGGKPKDRFVVFYLQKIFPRLEVKEADFYLDYLIPIAVPVLAFFLQIVLDLEPLIRI